jgi:hypothetical protein
VSGAHAGSPEAQLPKPLAAALAPLDRRAFGAAAGTVCGLGVFLLTAAELLRPPGPGPNLALLGHYLPGYAVSPEGALVGLGWAFGIGFCAGWFLALVRNLGIAAWIFIVRGRHELAVTRDFLDHI